MPAATNNPTASFTLMRPVHSPMAAIRQIASGISFIGSLRLIVTSASPAVDHRQRQRHDCQRRHHLLAELPSLVFVVGVHRWRLPVSLIDEDMTPVRRIKHGLFHNMARPIPSPCAHQVPAPLSRRYPISYRIWDSIHHRAKVDICLL